MPHRPVAEPAGAPRLATGVEIEPVAGRAAMERFIRLPFALHRDDPLWVPPLLMERRAALSPKHNPFFRHADAAFWIARRQGRDVGRISAQIDRLGEAGTGHFGLLAAEDDADIVATLTETAEEWLRARGAERVLGPFNLSINEETGLLVDGFDTPPMMMMGHDRPHLGPLLERAGYAKAKDVLAYVTEDPELPAGIKAILDRPLPPNIRIRRLRMAEYRSEVGTLTDIFNDAWSGNWGFIPLTPDEVDHMARQMKPLIDERLVWFAEVDGEPAAFAVCLPNLNEAIRDLDGRMLPLGWAKLLWRLKVSGLRSARVPLMGVRRKHAGSLTGSLLAFLIMAAIRREAAALGLRRIEMSWVLEDNRPMRRIAEAVGSRAYKTYRIYGKAL
ncbi:MAG: dATP pyrophosphohydrolase [Achromobacter sp.]|uniref:dATP pyrophosphohydrolase n=1 Tax=Achromobacter sp. TaxID=134375 RepID=UPI002584D417|nr:dATP pyrophosphohydrolase [Achromobacter sp.]MCW0210951.1 dATP pyrophosphohydrolase [Achromobacter sp.]